MKELLCYENWLSVSQQREGIQIDLIDQRTVSQSVDVLNGSLKKLLWGRDVVELCHSMDCTCSLVFMIVFVGDCISNVLRNWLIRWYTKDPSFPTVTCLWILTLCTLLYNTKHVPCHPCLFSVVKISSSCWLSFKLL